MRFVPPTVVSRGIALVCVSFLLAACGDDSEPAAEPTAQELFCDAYAPYFRAAEADTDADEAEIVARMKSLASIIIDLETPEDMPEDAAAGMALWASSVDALPDDATQMDVMEALNAETTLEEQGQMGAFIAYGNNTCI